MSGASEVKVYEVPKPTSNFKSFTKRFDHKKDEDIPGYFTINILCCKDQEPI